MPQLLAPAVRTGGCETRIGTRRSTSGARRSWRPVTSKLAPWRKRLFILMSRNAQSAATFFNLPPNRVVELGAQIQL